jgi:hypothetical protein
MWIGAVSKKRIFSSPECIFSTPTNSVDRLKREITCILFSTLWVFKIRTMLIYQTKNLHVTGYSRVCWSKFGWWWLMKQIVGTRMYIILHLKSHLLTSKQRKKYHMNHKIWIGAVCENRIFSWPESIFSTPPKSVVRLYREISSRLFSSPWVLKIRTMLIYQKKRICNRLYSSKLIEIWVLINFETNKRNTNVEHISYENTFTNL